MTDAFFVTTAVTILLAFTGYLATYFNNLRLAQRNQRLERVSKQLGELSGPPLRPHRRRNRGLENIPQQA